MRSVAILVVVASLAACAHDGGNLAGETKPAAAQTPPENPHVGTPPPAPAAAREAPLAWTVPDGWSGGASTRPMRVAEFDVGADESGAAVQCVVYGGIGGDDEQNLTRWIDQMGDAAKASAKTTHVDHDGLKITRLEVRGAYADSMRSGGAKTIDAATMLAAIVDGPSGKLHVKLVGASSVVDAAAPKFDAFLASMKPK